MPKISDYAAAGDYTKVEPDVYAGTIVSANVVMDKDNPALPATDQYGKNRLLLKVQLDEQDDEGNPIELQRQLAISYGKNNSTGQHAALAVLLAAAMGVPAGDAAQKHVTTEQLIGKRVRVRTDNVEKNGTTYTNILDFMAMRKNAPSAPTRGTAAALGIDEDLDLEDEIPF